MLIRIHTGLTDTLIFEHIISSKMRMYGSIVLDLTDN